MRIVERLLSLLVALAVAAGSVVLALEVGWAAFGRDPLLVPWGNAYTAGTTRAWDSTPVRAVAVGLLVVGVLLLVAELTPRRARRLAMSNEDPTISTAITRRSLRSSLLETTRQVDGLSDAKVRVSRRKVAVRAVSRLGSPETARQLTDQLEDVLHLRLDALGLARPPRLSARVAPRGGSGSA